MQELLRTDYKFRKRNITAGKLENDCIIKNFNRKQIARYIELAAHECVYDILSNSIYDESKLDDKVEFLMTDDKMIATVMVNNKVVYDIYCIPIDIYTEHLRTYRGFSISYHDHSLYIITSIGEIIHRRKIYDNIESLENAYEKLYKYIDVYLDLLNGKLLKNEKES